MLKQGQNLTCYFFLSTWVALDFFIAEPSFIAEPIPKNEFSVLACPLLRFGQAEKLRI